MSCNGCRVLRKGCSETCILRPCLQWIESPVAQGHATVFVAKFFGRAGLMSFISAVSESQRPGIPKKCPSLLFEACGRTINPVNGAAGLLGSGNWHLCQAAVDTVLRGGTLKPLPELDRAATDDGAGAAGVGGEGGFLYGRPRAGGWYPTSEAKRRKVSAAAADDDDDDDLVALQCDLDLCLTPGSPAAVRVQKRPRPATPSMTSEGSVTTSGESGGDRQPRLLNLFV